MTPDLARRRSLLATALGFALLRHPQQAGVAGAMALNRSVAARPDDTGCHRSVLPSTLQDATPENLLGNGE